MRPEWPRDPQRFDTWLETCCAGPAVERNAALMGWDRAPDARFCHPREEHLLPLMVAAGAAAEEPGRLLFRDEVMGVIASAFEFGGME